MQLFLSLSVAFFVTQSVQADIRETRFERVLQLFEQGQSPQNSIIKDNQFFIGKRIKARFPDTLITYAATMKWEKDAIAGDVLLFSALEIKSPENKDWTEKELKAIFDDMKAKNKLTVYRFSTNSKTLSFHSETVGTEKFCGYAQDIRLDGSYPKDGFRLFSKVTAIDDREECNPTITGFHKDVVVTVEYLLPLKK